MRGGRFLDNLEGGSLRRLALVLIALLSLVVAGSARAQVTFDQASSFSGDATIFTWSHTVGTGANKILIVGGDHDNCNDSIASITFAGQNLVPIGNECTGGNDNKRVHIWRLLNPPTVTANVVVTLSAKHKAAMGATSYFGVDQTTPYGPLFTAFGTGTTAQVTVDSSPCQLVVDVLGTKDDAGVPAAGTGQIQRWSVTSGGGSGGSRAGGSTEPGTPSVPMSWTLATSKEWAIVAISLKPAESLAAAFTAVKSYQIVFDPYNGASNPKAIPGAEILYTVILANTGSASPDANSVVVTDPVPARIKLFVNHLGGAGSGPVLFTDGSTSSTLTYTFTSLASTTDDISFSNDGGATYNYTPVADGNGYDATVTHLRANPKGTFAPACGVSPSPSFSLQFKAQVK